MADTKEPGGHAVEPPRQSSNTRVERYLKSHGDYLWSFGFLALLIGLLGIHSPRGIIKIEVGQTALAVFQVAVTLYALILTAATVIYTQIEKLRTYTARVSTSDYLNQTAKEEKIVTAKTSVEESRGKAVFAAQCSLAAVVVSTLAMFTPGASYQPWPLAAMGFWIRIDYAVLAAAIGLLMLSVGWLTPLILGFLDPGLMKDVDDELNELKKSALASPAAQPPAPAPGPVRVFECCRADIADCSSNCLILLGQHPLWRCNDPKGGQIHEPYPTEAAGLTPPSSLLHYL